MILILLIAYSRLSLLGIDNIAAFMCSFLHKEPIGYEILVLYDIHVTHTNLQDEIFNLPVPLNKPKKKYGDIIIFKDAINIPELFILEGSSTIKALRIYQDYSTEIFNVIPMITIEFDTIKIVNILILIIIQIG